MGRKAKILRQDRRIPRSPPHHLAFLFSIASRSHFKRTQNLQKRTKKELKRAAESVQLKGKALQAGETRFALSFSALAPVSRSLASEYSLRRRRDALDEFVKVCIRMECGEKDGK
jgi:hypothetical protein